MQAQVADYLKNALTSVFEERGISTGDWEELESGNGARVKKAFALRYRSDIHSDNILEIGFQNDFLNEHLGGEEYASVLASISGRPVGQGYRKRPVEYLRVGIGGQVDADAVIAALRSRLSYLALNRT